MTSILLKGAQIASKTRDAYIEDGRFKEISVSIKHEADYKINARGKALVSSFVNAHAHSAMTLFRSYADDIPLQTWLEKHIWPKESKLDSAMVSAGTKLACLEMIRSGTTYCFDMYLDMPSVAKAFKEMGFQAAACEGVLELFDEARRNKYKRMIEKVHKDFSDDPIVDYTLGPHAIYTVSEEMLRWMGEYSKKHNLKVHMHVSETKKEVEDCIKQHKLRPIEYLDTCGLLSNRFLGAHAVHVNNKEIALLKKRKAHIVHNPEANMKLAVGAVFPYKAYNKAKINMCLGTDGAGSNNSLSMFSSMKTAALLQKQEQSDAKILSASEAFTMATKNGFSFAGIDAGIAKGKVAHAMLIDLKTPCMTPNHNLLANLVYAANPSCVDTVIANGMPLMISKRIDNEENIISQVQEQVERLF